MFLEYLLNHAGLLHKSQKSSASVSAFEDEYSTSLPSVVPPRGVGGRLSLSDPDVAEASALPEYMAKPERSSHGTRGMVLLAGDAAINGALILKAADYLATPA